MDTRIVISTWFKICHLKMNHTTRLNMKCSEASQRLNLDGAQTLRRSQEERLDTCCTFAGFSTSGADGTVPIPHLKLLLLQAVIAEQRQQRAVLATFKELRVFLITIHEVAQHRSRPVFWLCYRLGRTQKADLNCRPMTQCTFDDP